MRRVIDFECVGDRLIGTVDEAPGKTGLLIVSGGNEIRSGAYAGQAALAQYFAALGYPVFRYDRRGVGDSEGINAGFESSADDIEAAVNAFRTAAPQVQRLVAFGNCDAASALAFFHNGLAIDALVLVNPWVIATANDSDGPNVPSAAAVRARYLARLKKPRSMIDLLTGKVDLKKLALGLSKAAKKDVPSGLAARLAEALATAKLPVEILIAERDTTALAFMGVWKDVLFAPVRANGKITLSAFDTASHSFADDASKNWLRQNIARVCSSAV